MSSDSMNAAEPIPVTVVDAGVGNLGNVARALRRASGEPTVSCDPEQVAAARRLVLPGVGAFRPPREALRGELEAAIAAALEAGAQLLGICVGYQLLFSASEEFGRTPGLGLLAGTVRKLPGDVALPHIGWNRLRLASGSRDPLLSGLKDGSWFYYVHSFAPEGVSPSEVLGTTLHGHPFVAAARRGRVAGVQFHPEKSGDAGLRLLHNFLVQDTGLVQDEPGEAA